MKKKVMLGAMALAVAVPVIAIPMQDVVFANTEADFGYKDNGDGTVTINQYKSASKDVVIPSKIAGKTVVAIGVTSTGFGVFQNKQVTSLSIPDSITSIGKYAFYNSQLPSVVIPSSVITIDDYAFAGNKLTTVDIPDSVTTIGTRAFEFNLLTELTLPDNVVKLGAYSFSRNNIGSVKLSKGLTELAPNVFATNTITQITIPNNIVSIGASALEGNLLTKIEIPTGVTAIGENAFKGNRITQAYIPGTVTAIADTSFTGNQPILADLKILGISGSTANVHAIKMRYTFQEHDFAPPVVPSPPIWTPDQTGGQFVSTLVPDVTAVGGKPITGITLDKFDYGVTETITTELGDIKLTADGNGNTILTAPNGLGTSTTNTRLEVEYKGTHILTLIVKPIPKVEFKFNF